MFKIQVQVSFLENYSYENKFRFDDWLDNKMTN